MAGRSQLPNPPPHDVGWIQLTQNRCSWKEGEVCSRLCGFGDPVLFLPAPRAVSFFIMRERKKRTREKDRERSAKTFNAKTLRKRLFGPTWGSGSWLLRKPRQTSRHARVHFKRHRGHQGLWRDRAWDVDTGQVPGKHHPSGCRSHAKRQPARGTDSKASTHSTASLKRR